MDPTERTQPAPGLEPLGDDARFRQEVKASTHRVVRLGGLAGLISFPSWAGFDMILAPDNAADFLVVRLVAVVVMALIWLSIFTKVGRRHPEVIALSFLMATQTGLAIMIGMLEASHAAYGLAFATQFWIAGFFLIWHPQYSILFAALSLSVLTVAWALLGGGTSQEIASVAFFAVTSAVIGAMAQVMRQASSRKEFDIRMSLKREQKRSEELVARLRHLSRQDPLTGLHNRRAWDKALETQCARATRGGSPFAVLLCDLDSFKAINDSLGHACGDEVIQATAEILKRDLRTGDIAARLGGDEFAVLAADSDLEQAEALAERLRAKISQLGLLSRQGFSASASIGIATWRGPEDCPATLYGRADKRMYIAKESNDRVISKGEAPLATINGYGGAPPTEPHEVGRSPELGLSTG